MDVITYLCRVGGIRRINIPPNMAFIEGVEDGKPGPIPDGEKGSPLIAFAFHSSLSVSQDTAPGDRYLQD